MGLVPRGIHAKAVMVLEGLERYLQLAELNALDPDLGEFAWVGDPASSFVTLALGKYILWTGEREEMCERLRGNSDKMNEL